MVRIPLLFLLAALIAPRASALPSHVKFDTSGTVYVDGSPFFPVGLFTYSLDGNVLQEIHQQQFNTVITLTDAHSPGQLDMLNDHGLMAICPTRDNWLKEARDKPALLAWYLEDEPEGHGHSPVEERERYLAIKKDDPNHPVGICHFLWEAIEKYKDACDFTMTDVYPITANRDVPITHVGKFVDEARRVHGAGWPHWAYIQIFGGPDTDGGKWAQPMPDEVRCMAYEALVHGANGILYFPYWAKAPRVWDSLGPLNHEIHAMAPWLVAKGTETAAPSSDDAVQTRIRRVGTGGIIIAVNTTTRFTDSTITLPQGTGARLEMPFEARVLTPVKGRLRDNFGPYETHVYTWGAAPVLHMARRK